MSEKELLIEKINNLPEYKYKYILDYIENAKAMYQRVYAHDINYQEVKQRLDNLN